MAQQSLLFLYFFILDQTRPNHLGWAETGLAHGPHGCRPDPTTMFIVLPLHAKPCNAHHPRGNKRKGRERLV